MLERQLKFLVWATAFLLLLYVHRALDGGIIGALPQHSAKREASESVQGFASQSKHVTPQAPLTEQSFSTKNNTEGEEKYAYSIRDQITNSTLGFEKIFAINLPERSDRRDQLALMSSYQVVKITWVEGIKGKDVPRKAWPPKWNADTRNESVGAIGCWRSHANTLRRIVDEKIFTALILEDDADWDVDLKEQLVTFAGLTRNLDNRFRPEQHPLTLTTPSHSPYGDHWDILWIGSSQNPPGPDDSQLFPGKGDQMHWVWPESRWGMAGTTGYAIKYEAARKLLGYLHSNSEPIDLTISRFCATTECVAVWPALIGSHIAAGINEKDSDIRRPDDSGPEVRATGRTRGVVDSAILDAWKRSGFEQ